MTTPRSRLNPSHNLTIWFICTLASTALPSLAAETLPAIHVVRVGLGNAAGLRLNADTSVGACQAAKGLPIQPLPLPSNDVLSALELVEEEEFFDNGRWALYRTVRHLGADAQAGCKLAIFFERSVKLETNCEPATHARAPVLDIMTDVHAAATLPAITVKEGVSGRSGKCNSRAQTADTSVLPTDNAGAGVRCIWASTMLRQSMGKPTGNATPDSTDFCYYAKRPFYVHDAVRRHILLKSVFPETNAAGTHMPSLFGAMSAAAFKLKSLTESASLPASKFTRASAEAFVNQPRKQSIPL